LHRWKCFCSKDRCWSHGSHWQLSLQLATSRSPSQKKSHDVKSESSDTDESTSEFPHCSRTWGPINVLSKSCDLRVEWGRSETTVTRLARAMSMTSKLREWLVAI
jgi:hypothetical protein